MVRMAAKRLTERVTAPFAGSRVDRAAGQIRDVLICGTESANGRDYPTAVLRRDYAAYEGRPVNCDHGREATVDRRFGWFSGVEPGTDGRPRGTLNVLLAHPMAARVFEAAERNPALFGFSHVAMCDTARGPGGRDVVEAIREVESIDLVAIPATTKGLFEGRTVGITVKALCEALVRHPKVSAEQVGSLKRLAEMDGMADVPVADMEAPPDDTADAGEGITAAFKAAFDVIRDQVFSGELTKKEARKRFDALFDGHDEAQGKKAAPDEGGTDGDPATPEGKKPKGDAILEALEACKTIGFRPDADDLQMIAEASAARRPALAGRLKQLAEGTGAEKARSWGRDPAPAGKTTEGREPAAPQFSWVD